jgi:hypothetical protein
LNFSNFQLKCKLQQFLCGLWIPSTQIRCDHKKSYLKEFAFDSRVNLAQLSLAQISLRFLIEMKILRKFLCFLLNHLDDKWNSFSFCFLYCSLIKSGKSRNSLFKIPFDFIDFLQVLFGWARNTDAWKPLGKNSAKDS